MSHDIAEGLLLHGVKELQSIEAKVFTAFLCEIENFLLLGKKNPEFVFKPTFPVGCHQNDSRRFSSRLSQDLSGNIQFLIKTGGRNEG